MRDIYIVYNAVHRYDSTKAEGVEEHAWLECDGSRQCNTSAVAQTPCMVKQTRPNKSVSSIKADFERNDVQNNRFYLNDRHHHMFVIMQG